MRDNQWERSKLFSLVLHYEYRGYCMLLIMLLLGSGILFPLIHATYIWETAARVEGNYDEFWRDTSSHVREVSSFCIRYFGFDHLVFLQSDNTVVFARILV